MNHVLSTSWGFGLFVISGFLGGVGSFVLFLLFRSITGARSKIICREFLYTGVVIGIVERFFFTTMIGWLGMSGIAPAAIGWIAIKGQIHYKIFSEKENLDLSRAYLGLLGSLSSLIFAVAGGFVWSTGITPDTFFDWVTHAF